MIRVVLVDDHAVVRMGFRMLLQAEGADITVVGEAADGEALLKGLADPASAWQADVIVMDLSMPGLGGLETLRRLRVDHQVPAKFIRKRYLDAQTAQNLALSQLDGAASPFDALSEREFEVFVRLARGRSVAEIAEALSLSPSTVGTHLYNIKQKLAAGNQAELTLLALRWGVIEA